MLRDELLVAVRSCPQNDYDTRMLVETILMPIIEHALAAERAATIEQCARVADVDARQSRALAEDRYGSPVGDFDEDHFLHEASAADEVARNIRTLPRDRSALEDATKMAAAQARHGINQKVGEYLGQDANAKSLLQMLDDALAQARREQREKDAQIAGDDSNPHRSIHIAAAILAQED